MKVQIDEDIEDVIKNIAKENEVSPKEAVNSILKTALMAEDLWPEDDEDAEE